MRFRTPDRRRTGAPLMIMRSVDPHSDIALFVSLALNRGPRLIVGLPDGGGENRSSLDFESNDGESSRARGIDTVPQTISTPKHEAYAIRVILGAGEGRRCVK